MSPLLCNSDATTSEKKEGRRRSKLRSLFLCNKAATDSSHSKQQQSSRVIHLIEEGDWTGLREHLSTKIGLSEAANLPDGALSSIEGDAKGQTILHLLCRVRHPVDITQMIVEAFPDAVRQRNSKGQTPLHLAAACCSPPATMRYLIAKYEPAASMKDANDKTPLHLCCEHCCVSKGESDEGDSDDSSKSNSLIAVVQALCGVAPTSINEEDNEDMTPLEYCISNGADYKVVRILQKASEHAWKASQKKTPQTRRSLRKYQYVASDEDDNNAVSRLTERIRNKSVDKPVHRQSIPLANVPLDLESFKQESSSSSNASTIFRRSSFNAAA